MSSKAPNDYDSPWKEALELFFAPAIELLAPELHALVDWRAPVQFLDKELQAVERAAAPAQGRQHVDKLALVRLNGGGHAQLQIHLEAQGRLDFIFDFERFARRVFQYHFLLGIKAQRKHAGTTPPKIYSLGILIDQAAGKHPPRTELSYSDSLLEQKTEFTFPVVELSQWLERSAELHAIAPTNPFAVFVMAQLAATRHPNKSTRLAPLLAIVRGLYGYGYDRQQIGQLLRLVEWAVRLPDELEIDYLQAARQLEQEHEMSYVTIAERVFTKKGMELGLAQGIETGIQQGLERGIQQGLVQGLELGQANLLLRLVERRFGAPSAEIQQKIKTASAKELEVWALNFVDAAKLEDVFRN